MRWQLLYLILFFTSCTPLQRLERMQHRHPYLFESKEIRETVQVIVPEVKLDTITLLSADTITITKDRLQIRYRTLHDSIWLEGKCEADTIYKEVIIQSPQTPKYSAKPRNYWVFILIALVLILLISFKK